MNDYELTEEQIIELEDLHSSLRDKRMADRVKAVVALAKGWSAATIAEILLIDEKTSREYFKTYVEKGPDALLTMNYQGGECRLFDFQLAELSEHLEEHTYLDAKSVVRYIQQEYGVTYSISGVTKILHRLGFSYKKPTQVPGKQDPEKQAEFLEFYEDLKDEKGSEDPIYFVDATHPMHNSVPSHGWIKKGTEKELKANSGRKRLNINGALNIETLETTIGFYDKINAQSMIDFFKKILAKNEEAEKIYVIVDNAGYNRAKVLKNFVKKTKIEIIYLPPYSPNLNLIERYWKFFKKMILYNQYYETFAEFVGACKSFFRKRKKYIPELRSLITENFHLSII